MGTEITKVESLNGGDITHQWPPLPNGHSLYFDSVNRDKRSVCIDLCSVEGREILEKLIVESDVLVENFKLGTLEKQGKGITNGDERLNHERSNHYERRCWGSVG